MRAILMRAIPRMVARLLVAALPWIAVASLPMQMPGHLTAEQSEFFGSAINTVREPHNGTPRTVN
jgi:hypothetical protein